MGNNNPESDAQQAQPKDNTRVNDNVTQQQESPAVNEVQKDLQSMSAAQRAGMFAPQGESAEAANRSLPQLKLLEGVGKGYGQDTAQSGEKIEEAMGKGTRPSEAVRPGEGDTPAQKKAERAQAEPVRPGEGDIPGAKKVEQPKAEPVRPGEGDTPGAKKVEQPKADPVRPGEGDTPGAKKVEQPKAEQPKLETQQQLPDGNKLEAPFTSGLKAGEGPYQALQRQNPQWSHEQTNAEAQRILKETGRKEFKQGEQFRTNPDGSVTTHEDSRKRDGSFTETTSKDGRKTEEKVGDGKGNWTSQKFDENGKVTGSVEHKAGKDGSYSETQKDADGKVIGEKSHTVEGKYTRDSIKGPDGEQVNVYDKKGEQTYSLHTKPDGSGSGWRKNGDGSQTIIDKPDANHHNEKTSKDGQHLGEKRWTTDDKGRLFENFDKDGNQTKSIKTNKDGSESGWVKKPDGTEVKIDQPDKDHRTETYSKDGKPDGKTTWSTDDKGTTAEGYDASGKKTSSHLDKKDGSSEGWKINPDGSTSTYQNPDANHYYEKTTKDGKTVSELQGEVTNNGTKEVITAKDGKTTNEFDTKNRSTASVLERQDGSVDGWRLNQDGSRTDIKGADKNHRTETTTKDGKEIKKVERETTDKGSTEITTDDKGKTTMSYDKDGKPIAGKTEGKDGKTAGWEKRADGTVMSFEQPDAKTRHETYSKDGKPIAEKHIETTESGRIETTTGAEGKTINTFGKDGKPTAGYMERKDGSKEGWKANNDGSMTYIKQPDADHRTETTTKDGQTLRSKETVNDKDGTTTTDYDKDHKATGHMRENKDGSASGWTRNADGSVTTYNRLKNGQTFSMKMEKSVKAA